MRSSLVMLKLGFSSFVISLTLLVSVPACAEWFAEEQAIMGTLVDVELWHADREVARSAIAAVMTEMRRIDSTMSVYQESSAVAIINKRAYRQAVPVSDELYTLLDVSLKVSKQSDGAFDISFASVGHLYDYRQSQAPEPGRISALLEAIDYRLISLNRDERSVSFAHPQLRIDLGGIAKGHAVDNCIAILRQKGIRYARVRAGGDTRVLGDKRGRPWMVAIADPRNKRKNAVVIPLSDTAISTSGDYERFFEKNGERIHHIIVPATGNSAREVQSVTILGPQARQTDALSTAVFVLGVAKGLRLINSLQGVDAVIIDRQRKMHYSDDLMPPR